MRWRLANRADRAGNALAKRHYTCQSPDSDQFVPPGACVVLVIPRVAVWVTSWPKPEYTKHDWPGAWVNSIFRNERGRRYLSSELIREAIAATRYFWPHAPAMPLGLITFVAAGKVKAKRDPGYCYLQAGFEQLFTYDYTLDYSIDPERPELRRVPRTTIEEGHLVFQMRPEDMPAAEAPIGAQRLLGVA